MICHCCHENKLSKEFPHEYLTEECTDHALLHCLRCVTASVQDHHKCSQCKVQVAEDNIQYKQYIQTLEYLFPTVVAIGDTIDATSQSIDPNGDESEPHIVIITLSGDSTIMMYDPLQTITSVKEIVQKELKIPCKRQCLMYNYNELKAGGQNNGALKLEDYNVQPNSTIYLLVLLYTIPDGFDHVIFDLCWGYPRSSHSIIERLGYRQKKRGRDYLDASVFLYSGSQFRDVIDYSHAESALCPAVKHSGDVMDDTKRLGHHTIDVSLKSIPADIDRLVFTLSAWNSPNISKYPNPSLRFFNAKFPDRKLCDDKMEHAAYSQAIIMCCLTNRDGDWRVFSLKHLSAGNTTDYNPLKNTIQTLILSGKTL